MGFGILFFGYITMLGVFPDLFIYTVWYSVFIPAAAGLLIFAAFFKLRGYNIHLKITMHITVLYILTVLVLGFAPFLIEARAESDELIYNFLYISKIVRTFVLFLFHYFMFAGIRALASDVGSLRIYKSANSSLFLTYIYFGLTILGVFDFEPWYYIMMLVLTLLYFVKNLGCIYHCFLQITYDGHDEAREAKREAKIAAKAKAKSEKAVTSDETSKEGNKKEADDK